MGFIARPCGVLARLQEWLLTSGMYLVIGYSVFKEHKPERFGEN